MGMTLQLNETTLPAHAKLRQKAQSEVAKNRALNADLTVDRWADFYEWEVIFPLMVMAEWDTMKTLYEWQHTNNDMLRFRVTSPDVNIDTKVYMSAPSRGIQFGGKLVSEGFTVELEQANASS